ncbi:hypothetical protein CA606_16675 [Caulobacter vibrioides]|uniref:Uncharacterized protein n=1 Tax=Caulobacter vibrioides TaxID=155892 RepID=A0A290MPB8_CAUVI|nr:hypothetical protein CA606_16675 [Caulobacter vibrioides]
MEGPADRATPRSAQGRLPPTGCNPTASGPLHPRSRVPLPRWGRRAGRPPPAAKQNPSLRKRGRGPPQRGGRVSG